MFFLAVMPEMSHPFPSRTRKLSSPGPMVLQAQACGRVGRCRGFEGPNLLIRPFAFCAPAVGVTGGARAHAARNCRSWCTMPRARPCRSRCRMLPSTRWGFLDYDADLDLSNRRMPGGVRGEPTGSPSPLIPIGPENGPPLHGTVIACRLVVAWINPLNPHESKKEAACGGLPLSMRRDGCAG
jgi:hypothetical protein